MNLYVSEVFQTAWLLNFIVSVIVMYIQIILLVFLNFVVIKEIKYCELFVHTSVIILSACNAHAAYLYIY